MSDLKSITVADTIDFLRYLRDEREYLLPVILPDHRRYVAVAPLAAAAAVIVGQIGDRDDYDRHWWYPTLNAAVDAMLTWVAAGALGEPSRGGMRPSGK